MKEAVASIRFRSDPSSAPPRLTKASKAITAILKKPKGDLRRAPLVYPNGGSAERDEEVRREILRRWGE